MTHDPITLFFDAVARTGLLEEPTLSTLAQEIRAEGAASQEEVAAKLVERQVLTPYQAERLLVGEGQDCILAGRYHLLEKIGTGGMGSVFRARDTKLDRIVAVKVMAPHRLSDADAVARFKREARALAQLALPNVVQAFDSGEDQGRNFLVMEFVKGIGLHQLVRDKGKLPPTIAADYVYQTAIGMQRAHERGMVHRDLKPANLLLTPDGEIKILDLGLARFVQDHLPDAEITRDNVGLGTPDYMAPEQFRDARSVDPRADIYALGCTFYYLIAGLVPFPGSSLSEKAHAHENKEPPPLEERCPEISAGLTMIVSRMMAKRPADRFQSMRAVAEALAPYVSASSPSLPSIKQTVSFLGDQMVTGRRPRKRQPFMIGAAITIGALVIALLALLLPRLWNTGETQDDGNLAAKNGSQQGDNKTPTGNGKKPPEDGAKNKPDGGKDKTPEPPKVVTIPNGLTVAQDGTGQFKTIKEALDKVEPGQTIRVLDKATYAEEFNFSRKSQFAGITLEAVQGATLRPEKGTKNLIEINGVANFTLRGFSLRTDQKLVAFIWVYGSCPGLILEHLDIATTTGHEGTGIEFSCEATTTNALHTMRNNTIRGCGSGLFIVGCAGTAEPGYNVARPRKYLRVEGNSLVDCEDAIRLVGSLSEIQLVGNQILWATRAGILLDNLLPGTQNLLIANNTVLESNTALRLWDTGPKGKNICFCNNLFLGHDDRDLVFLNNRGKTDLANPDPGDGALVTSAWTLTHNWRELKNTKVQYAGWIRPGPKDHVLEKIKVLSRKQGEKDFLRPPNGSDLATKGAGSEDPAFPTYVGAIAPEEADPWSWQWTWDAWMQKTLTVSQDPKDNARFPSISAALEKVQPGMSIRVMDKGTYGEQLNIADPARHKGITLDAVQGATIAVKPTDDFGLRIDNVPHVTVKGFHFLSEKPLAGKGLGAEFLITVKRAAPGLRLEGLHLQTTNHFGGIFLSQVANEPDDPPVRIAGCQFDVKQVAVIALGLPQQPTSRVFVCHNQFQGGTQGVAMMGAIKDVLVAGNVARGARDAGIEFYSMTADSKNVLIANNTLFGGDASMRFMQSQPGSLIPKKQLAIHGNIFYGAKRYDIVYAKGSAMSVQPTDSKFLLDLIDFSHNWRDLATVLQGEITPLADKDHKLEGNELVSLTPGNKHFLQPKKDSPLATGGAGPDDPDLPPYVGAIPPEGINAWDWEKTWKKKFERR